MKKYIVGFIFGALYLVVCPAVALICAAVNLPYVVSRSGDVKFNCNFEESIK